MDTFRPSAHIFVIFIFPKEEETHALEVEIVALMCKQRYLLPHEVIVSAVPFDMQ